jgi:hypothetical protein
MADVSAAPVRGIAVATATPSCLSALSREPESAALAVAVQSFTTLVPTFSWSRASGASLYSGHMIVTVVSAPVICWL